MATTLYKNDLIAMTASIHCLSNPHYKITFANQIINSLLYFTVSSSVQSAGSIYRCLLQRLLLQYDWKVIMIRRCVSHHIVCLINTATQACPLPVPPSPLQRLPPKDHRPKIIFLPPLQAEAAVW